MKSRWIKVKKILARENACALLIINSENAGQPGTQYLSGFSGSSSVILVSVKNKILITDSRYTIQAKREAKGFEIIILKPNETISTILKKHFSAHNIKKILIDGALTSYSSIENIKKTVPEIEIISKSRILQEFRKVKDKKEIALLKQTAKIASRAFLKFLPEIKAGVSENTLAERLDALCKKESADGMAFDTIVASGKNGALPHAKPSDKKLQKGELVVIDWGIKYKGYVSDMTRTVAIGEISPRLKKMYEAVQKAQELGCKFARAGITGHDLDAVCRNYLHKKGLGKYFDHSTGHGIGQEIHELPVIAPKQHEKLQAGAAITCEPGVYIKNVGGVRIEDSLIITKNGSVNLGKEITKKLLFM